jgi:hypothetical protein
MWGRLGVPLFFALPARGDLFRVVGSRLCSIPIAILVMPTAPSFLFRFANAGWTRSAAPEVAKPLADPVAEMAWGISLH